jgi:hypothetical protein
VDGDHAFRNLSDGFIIKTRSLQTAKGFATQLEEDASVLGGHGFQNWNLTKRSKLIPVPSDLLVSLTS